jgi:Rps23 Pro-64 3,4-dihydroxylase Tpa1-like proline 4-hydroxylase
LLQSQEIYDKLRDTLSPELFITPFNRQLAQVLLERLAQGRGVAPELLAGMLRPQELGELTRLLHTTASSANPLEECRDCIRKLQTQRQGERRDLAAIDEESYLDLFSNLKI